MEISPYTGPPLAQSVTAEQPRAPHAPDGVVLENITVGLRCRPGIPIGTTGLYAVGVEGTVVLHPPGPTPQSVTITLWIESRAKYRPIPLVGVTALTTLVPRPFDLTMKSTIKLIGLH